MRKEPIEVIKELIVEKYSDAKAVFWAGSVFKNQGTPASDLDLVIVFESLPNAYREAFIYGSWPVDVFVHDLDTLRYFFEESKTGTGIPGLITMIIDGREILDPNPFATNIKQLAEKFKAAGPSAWSKEQIEKERFHITDTLDDIKFPKNREEQITSAVHLFEPLIQFNFRAQGKWSANGKTLIRLLKAENPELAKEFNQSFENFFKTGDTLGIENLVQKILAPYGGLLWNGFRSEAPTEWKVKK
jgi:predicted nucleotidyltransferase